MSEQFHIIIAGEKSRPISFKVSKTTFIASTSLGISLLCILFSTGILSTGFFTYNKFLAIGSKSAKNELHNTRTVNKSLEKKLAVVVEQSKNEISKIETESNKKITELEMQNLEQQMFFKDERDLLLSTAVNELNERSEFIEGIISNIGIKVKPRVKSDQENIGGPYVAAENAVYDDLLYRADHYIKTIQTLPLGKPVKGSISSWYGRRKDPLNDQKAFHEGIDFRGKMGDPVIATADGRITFAGKNGGFGKFIRIDHGNGYTTSFAHLKKYSVKSGDYISRGQVIGLVGSSGRSTGPHLHYEIAYRGKHVNPSKFMKVAKLSCNFDPPAEK